MLFSRFLALALALPCASAFAQSADQASVLSALSRQIADARADAAKARAAKCPPKLATLAGVPLGTVLIELGQAEGAQAADSLTYPIGARGAGGPEVTFRFNAQGVVTAVDCRGAK